MSGKVNIIGDDVSQNGEYRYWDRNYFYKELNKISGVERYNNWKERFTTGAQK